MSDAGQIGQSLFNGKTVQIIAPASAVAAQNFDDALAFLKRCGAKISDSVSGMIPTPEMPYFSGSFEQRSEAFSQAWNDLTADFILCTRGGYGCTPFLKEALEAVEKRREVSSKTPFLLGFSDITALQLALCTKGVHTAVASVHLNGLQDHLSHELTAQSLLSAVENTPYIYEQQTCANFSFFDTPQEKICVNAPLYAVNLSLLINLIGTPYMPDLNGALLLIEDVGEPVRKIDRMLAHLYNAGILTNLQGLLLGQWTDCGTEEERTAMFTYWTRRFFPGKPCIGFLPFGHEKPTLSVVQGSRAELTLCAQHLRLCLNVDNRKNSSVQPQSRSV